jgi:acetylglutamate kinase
VAKAGAITVLKLGGELVEDPERLVPLARTIARFGTGTPLVIVHGGGREIDAALARAGIVKRQVDGLRVTDAATLEIVVSVLAGAVNTRFVAAINGAGGRAVGLTAADADVAPVTRARPHLATNGTRVDLGYVGQPSAGPPPALVGVLVRAGFVPVVASIGATARGALLNVNADTLAGSLAARLGARRLIVAGGTPGVLDDDGRTIAALTVAAIRRLIASGSASAGMVAKLRACQVALAAGVLEVAIADGRDARRLAALVAGTAAREGAWTRLAPAPAERKRR